MEELSIDRTHNVCYSCTIIQYKGFTCLQQQMKKQAQEIFKQYGMGLSDAFNIFLSQSVPTL